ELDAQPGAARDERVDAGGERLEHHARVGRRGRPVAAGAVLEPEAAKQLIALDAPPAHPPGPAALGAPPVVLHLEEPVLGVDPSLAEESVGRRGGADVGDALAIAEDLDGSGGSGDALCAAHGRHVRYRSRAVSETPA